MIKQKKQSYVLYVGTFPPRECGIATFTRDLTSAVDKSSLAFQSKILAMNRNGVNVYNYPKKVIFQITDDEIKDYVEVAKKINKMNSIKLVNIQHEFGIFGGEYGDYIIPFIEILNKPIIINFHSVIPDPEDKLKETVRSIANKVDCITVMTQKGVNILRKQYGIKTKIRLIPHGIPNVKYNSNIKTKSVLGYKDKILLSSFGLMSNGKGYEYVIDALPKVVEKFPNLLYLIVGETHPVVRKKEGEKYRTFLEKKIKKLGLQNNVKFYNKYLTLNEIIKYLRATDVYICSSQNPNQITSGTLVYAMGCGKPVISTPFLHAKDLFNKKRGILTRFNSNKSFEKALLNILSDKNKIKNMGKECYYYTRHMTWPNVAIAHKKLFDSLVINAKDSKITHPEIKLNHLLRLTDDFGVIQFSNYTKPDPSSGYTLDDNSRAMITAAMHYNKFRDISSLKLIKKYLNFIKYVQQKDGRFYNYVDSKKRINLDIWADDPHGRALWALGYITSLDCLPKEIRNTAKILFKKSVNVTKSIKSPRAIAYSINGLYFFNKRFPSKLNIEKIDSLASWLVSLFNSCSTKDWKWFEDILSYSNSKLPESMFYAYLATRKKKYLDIAESSLEFLRLATLEKGVFTPIGNRGWFSKGGNKSHFDQQPVDTGSMVHTCILAHEINNKNGYKKDAINTFNWFLGNNALKQIVYDEYTGGCRDGVGKSSINLNQGAESTIAYLMSRLALYDELKKTLY
jgi:glycosyltransferase involved in cell wall biosynthesis